MMQDKKMGWGWLMRRMAMLTLALLPVLSVQAQAQRAAQPVAPRAAQPVLNQANQNVAYVLGPNDAITVQVYGQQEFNVQTRIKPDGTISVPLIGNVQASGKTVVTLADEMAARLKKGGYLKDPIVNVEINEYNSRWARVAGKVGSPGLVPLDRNYRVLDILLRSGWVQDAGASYVVLRRGVDGREITLNTVDLARGDPQKDPLVESGDTIFVPEADLVYVTGQINRPGPIALRPNMTVRQLLAMAGGVTQLGSSNRVSLTRGGKEIDANADTILQREDIVRVKERLF